MSEGLLVSLISVILVLTIAWPIGSMLTENSDENQHWMLITAVIISFDIPFLALTLLLDNKLRQNSRWCAIFIIIGTVMLLCGVISTALQIVPYVLDHDLDYFTEMVYLSVVSFSVNFALAVLLIFELKDLIMAYTLEQQLSENYLELEVDLTARASFRAQQLSWLASVIAVLVLFVITLINTVDNEQCGFNVIYWIIAFAGISFCLLLLAIPLFVFKSFYNQDSGLFLGLIYLLYIPLNTGWFFHGLGLLREGAFINCNTNITIVVLDLMVYGWLVIPGVLVGLGIFSVILTWVTSLVLRHLFPNAFRTIDRFHEELDNYSQEGAMNVEMREIHPEKFNPDNYRRSFVEKELCSICLEHFESDQFVVPWRGCKHLFHEACVQKMAKPKEFLSFVQISILSILFTINESLIYPENKIIGTTSLLSS